MAKKKSITEKVTAAIGKAADTVKNAVEEFSDESNKLGQSRFEINDGFLSGSPMPPLYVPPVMVKRVAPKRTAKKTARKKDNKRAKKTAKAAKKKVKKSKR